jgi:ribose transport system permease protein
MSSTNPSTVNTKKSVEKASESTQKRARGGIWDLISPIFLLLIVMFVFSYFLVPNFSTRFNLTNLVLQANDIMIVAVGLTFVVLNGGIDFSITSVMAMSSVFGAYIMALSPLAGTPWAVPVALIAMVSVGVIVGMVNGFSVTRFKMPSFIATLATMMIGSGVAVWFTSIVSERSSIGGLPEAFFALGGDRGHIWVPVTITVVLLLFAHWLLTYTVFGRRVYAVGTNPRTSHVSGLPVKSTIFWLMIICGVFAAIQGIIATGRNQAGIPSLGDRVFIDIIAAVIIGGTSVFGGAGGVRQTIYGVLFIALLNNVVNLLGVEWYVISLIKGILVLIAAFLDIWTRRRELVGR